MGLQNFKTPKWNRRRKRTSKRRWKKRCAIGRLIPGIAILEHRLDKWFIFRGSSVNMDASYAIPKTLRKIP